MVVATVVGCPIRGQGETARAGQGRAGGTPHPGRKGPRRGRAGPARRGYGAGARGADRGRDGKTSPRGDVSGPAPSRTPRLRLFDPSGRGPSLKRRAATAPP